MLRGSGGLGVCGLGVRAGGNGLGRLDGLGRPRGVGLFGLLRGEGCIFRSGCRAAGFLLVVVLLLVLLLVGEMLLRWEVARIVLCGEGVTVPLVLVYLVMSLRLAVSLQWRGMCLRCLLRRL